MARNSPDPVIGMIDLGTAYMRFHMLFTREDQYQWQLREDKINETKVAISTQITQLEAFNNQGHLCSVSSLSVPTNLLPPDSVQRFGNWFRSIQANGRPGSRKAVPELGRI